MNDDQSEAVTATLTFKGQDNDTTQHEWAVHAAGSKEARLEAFKLGVAKTLKAMRFA
jgi:hypothetical protein